MKPGLLWVGMSWTDRTMFCMPPLVTEHQTSGLLRQSSLMTKWWSSVCFMAAERKFGPFFFAKHKTVDSHSYKWLLAHKVIPMIKQRLGRDKFSQAIWQQDGAKPHQAHIVMNWLDTIFHKGYACLESKTGILLVSSQSWRTLVIFSCGVSWKTRCTSQCQPQWSSWNRGSLMCFFQFLMKLWRRLSSVWNPELRSLLLWKGEVLKESFN